jgi:hypothetical protein
LGEVYGRLSASGADQLFRPRGVRFAGRGRIAHMGLLWGLVRTVCLVFAVVIAALVVIDGTLLRRLLEKNE